MKIFVPQHIEWNFLTSYIRVWPFEVRLRQFLVILGGATLGGVVYSKFAQDPAGKTVWTIFGWIIFLIFLFIALFNISELSLIPFVVKKIKDNFLDTTKKYQVSYPKIDEIDLAISEAKLLKKDTDKSRPTKKEVDEDQIFEKIDELESKR